MEALATAMVGEAVSRFISFVSKKIVTQPSTDEKLDRLQRLLLRVHIIVEEAEERHITNKMMLIQLQELTNRMYQGYYILDTFKCQGDLDNVRWCSLLLPSSNPAKRARATATANTMRSTAHELQNVLESLDTRIAAVGEIALLLTGCPRLFRQPYSSYLFMDRCMFGRHVEREQAISFLLEIEHKVGILPVVGRHRVGKRTLVEHVCNDAGVRGKFSLIVFAKGHHLESTTITNIFDGCEIKHRNLGAPGGYLLVIEFADDDVVVDDVMETWNWKSLPSGSKIIVIGTNDHVANLGTAKPIRLRSLSPQEFWYFFKTLAFGSANPDDHHPKLLPVAMEIATLLMGSFVAASYAAAALRANLDVRLWCGLLNSVREMIELHLVRFGEYPQELLDRNHTNFLSMLPWDAEACTAIYTYTRIWSTEGEVPATAAVMQELILGRNIPADDAFEVLLWRSPVPPYRNVVASFIREKHQGLARTIRGRRRPR